MQGGAADSPALNTLHNIIVRVKDAGGEAQRTSPPLVTLGIADNNLVEIVQNYSYFIRGGQSSNGRKYCSPLFSYPDLRASSIIITQTDYLGQYPKHRDLPLTAHPSLNLAYRFFAGGEDLLRPAHKGVAAQKVFAGIKKFAP